MSILGPKCGIDGCKKGKLRPHTHFMGDMSRSGADQRYIELARLYAEMTGQKLEVPGGLEPHEINNTMAKRLKKAEKESKAFREGLKKRGKRI